MKCDRAPEACRRCEQAGKLCTYQTNDGLRIRDQTNAAADRAMSNWRTRSKHAQESKSEQPEVQSTSVGYSIALPVKDLAHQRFLYDFTGLGLTAFRASLQGFVERGAPGAQETGPVLAIMAVSLANFHKRHHDERAAKMAGIVYGRALMKLRDGLNCSYEYGSLTLVLTAVMLGLYHNIYRETDPQKESGAIGSWIHHFRGAVTLLRSCTDDTLELQQARQFLCRQAILTSLRMDILICLPNSWLTHLDRVNDLESRTLRLGYRVARLCAAWRDNEIQQQHSTSYSIHEHITCLQKDLDILGDELQRGYPYVNALMDPKAYPQWYWPISTHVGSPEQTHSYLNTRAGLVWNAYRMTRLKLISLMLQMEPTITTTPTQEVTIATAPVVSPDSRRQELNTHHIDTLLEQIDGICASVFSLVTMRCDGTPLPTNFEDIRGITAYVLITPVHAARDCIECKPSIATGTAASRLSWLRMVCSMFQKTLAVTEAWVWRDEDEEEARALIKRQLTFKD